MSVPQAVERGAALLDEQVPDWANRVELEALAMHNCAWCVLGQLFRSYFTGLRRLHLNDERARRLGFDIGPVQTYERLDQAWRTVIRRRKRA